MFGMDVTPVSMQMIYPTANEATNVQHNLNHAAALQQDFEALKQKQEDELKKKQVQNKDNPEGGTIKDEPDRQGRGGAYQRRAKKRNLPANNEPMERFAIDPSRGHHLDISL